MTPEQPYALDSRQETRTRALSTQPRSAGPVQKDGGPLADRLVTYLERLAIAAGHVRQVRAAYIDRLPDTAPAHRPESTPDRIADPDRERDR